jgi:RND family efflux transporter MFP subunit
MKLFKSLFGRIKKSYKKILLAILVIVLIIGWQSASNNPKVQTVAVKTSTPQNRVVTKTVSASGEIKSRNQADLSFPVSQKVTNLFVTENEFVKKGQLLATVESQSAAQTAQAYKDARDIALRQKELFIKNRDTEEETLGGKEQYEIKLRQYDEEISKATASYNAQLALVKNTALYAPFDGTVVDVAKTVGENATAGEIIMKVADLDQLYFELAIDQEDFGQLKNGMNATVELDAYPNYDFNAEIVELPLYVDTAANSTFTAKAHFKDINPEGNLPFLGMTGDIKIQSKSTESEVSSLYYDEIFSDDEYKAYVWTAENGVISKLPIEIGLEGDIYTELKQNIDKQIVVPVSNDAEIRDGYKAKIVK